MTRHITADEMGPVFKALPYIPQDRHFYYVTDAVIDRWVKESGYGSWRFATVEDGPGWGIVVHMPTGAVA